MVSLPSAVPSLPTVVGGENGHVGHSNVVYDEVEAIGRIVVGPTRYNLKGLGVVQDGTTDNAATFADIFADNGFGEYILPPSAQPALINSQLVVPNKTVVVGPGRGLVAVKAGASFPTSTPVVRLGDGTSIVFGTRLEDFYIDCNDIAGSTGVYSNEANEQCGLRNVVASKYRSIGAHFDTGASIVSINDCEMYGSVSGSTSGIKMQAVAGQNYIQGVTIKPNGAGTGTSGIDVDGCCVHIYDAHAEFHTDGIRYGGISGTGSVIGAFGHSSLTNVIHILSTSEGRVDILDSRKNGAAVNVLDDVETVSLTEERVSTIDRMIARYLLRVRKGAIGLDFNPANSATQPNAGVPWGRIGGGSNQNLVWNPGAATGRIYLSLDNAGHVDLGRGGGRTFIGTPNSAPTDADIGAAMVSFYLDQTGNNLKVRVKYADGTTLKTGTIALV